MKLESLEQFLFVMRYKSITKAAEALFISHSTVSRNLAALEEELGVKLFDRGPYELTPTLSGEILAKRYDVIRTELSDAFIETRNAGNIRQEYLRVAVKNYYDKRLFSFFQILSQEHPEIKYTLHYYNPRTMTDKMSKNEIDIGIVFSMEMPNDNIFDTYKIGEDELVLVVPEFHPLGNQKKIRAEALTGECIYTLNNTYKDIVRYKNNWVIKDLKNAEHKYESSIDNIIVHARSGIGIGLLPRPVITQRGGFSIVEIEDINTAFDILLVWKKDNDNTNLTTFIKSAKQYYKDRPQ